MWKYYLHKCKKRQAKLLKELLLEKERKADETERRLKEQESIEFQRAKNDETAAPDRLSEIVEEELESSARSEEAKLHNDILIKEEKLRALHEAEK